MARCCCRSKRPPLLLQLPAGQVALTGSNCAAGAAGAGAVLVASLSMPSLSLLVPLVLCCWRRWCRC